MTVFLITHGASATAQRWRDRYQRWFEKRRQTVLQLTTGATQDNDILTLHRYLERANEVLILAGDGTLHWLVNQLTEAQAQRLILSPIPCGTGNDFARDLGLLRADWRMREDEQLTLASVDIGELHGTRFVNAASRGLAADLVQRQGVRSKLWFGRVSYVLGVLAWWMRYQYQPQQANTPVLQSLLVGRFLGGGLCLAPQADRRHGLLTRVTVSAAPRRQLLGVLWAVLRGRHAAHPLVRIEQQQEFLLQASALEIDGEYYADPIAGAANVLRGFITVRVARRYRANTVCGRSIKESTV